MSGELSNTSEWVPRCAGWYYLLPLRTSCVNSQFSSKLMGQAFGLKAMKLKLLLLLMPLTLKQLCTYELVIADSKIEISKVLPITGKKPKTWRQNIILLQNTLEVVWKSGPVTSVLLKSPSLCTHEVTVSVFFKHWEPDDNWLFLESTLLLWNWGWLPPLPLVSCRSLDMSRNLSPLIFCTACLAYSMRWCM